MTTSQAIVSGQIECIAIGIVAVIALGVGCCIYNIVRGNI